jgi:phosphoribosylformylglycinamidine synthase subunit PurS
VGVIFSAVVDVMPKAAISDPQGQAIERALPGLGFDGIEHVRVGRRIEITLDAPDEDAAAEILARACDRFLANPAIEDFHITLGRAGGGGAPGTGGRHEASSAVAGA